MDPCVIRVRALPSGPDHAHQFHIPKHHHRIAISSEGEHLLLRVGDTWLRLDVVSGTLLEGSVPLEPIVAMERLELQVSELRKLD